MKITKHDLINSLIGTWYDSEYGIELQIDHLIVRYNTLDGIKEEPLIIEYDQRIKNFNFIIKGLGYRICYICDVDENWFRTALFNINPYTNEPLRINQENICKSSDATVINYIRR